jgi:16S rRNA (adenine1518-N6/adenine1519-N6)-dimethyltransferase
MSKPIHSIQDLTLKKSLGQHFLHNQEICLQIVEALDISNNSKVLEVGPGGGAITKYLLQVPNIELHCVEFDEEKVNFLLNTYPNLENKITNADFLQMEKPFTEQFNIIGNFPYNISTQIMFKILEWVDHVPQIVGMFQKEVALRYASKHGSKTYGITSVITQCFYDVEYIMDVAPMQFNPPPKVDSAVIKLTRNNNPFGIKNYNQFKSFVKVAFGQRRKTLRNAFKSNLPYEKLTDNIFNKRAEQLTPQEFAVLYQALYKD